MNFVESRRQGRLLRGALILSVAVLGTAAWLLSGVGAAGAGSRDDVGGDSERAKMIANLNYFGGTDLPGSPDDFPESTPPQVTGPTLDPVEFTLTVEE